MYDLKGLGKRIEDLRKKKGMTQENLAERLGVTSQAVSKWENGLCYPDIELIPTLCAIFEISLDDIFGKIKKDVSNLSFPPVFKGVNLVATFANIACYSDKEIIQTGIQGETAPSTIEFKDGSIAELSSRRVVNRGPGKIFLKTLDESFVSEDNIQSGFFKKLTETKINLEYGIINNLQCAIPNGNCIIEKCGDNKTTICAEGYPEFIDLLEFEYSENNKTLIIQYDKSKRDKINNEMNKWDMAKNVIKIKCALDGEKFDDLKLAIDGNGNIKLNVPAENADMSINGSGDISAPVSFANMTAKINGSGDISFVDSIMLTAKINGSGDINFNNANKCDIKINGSGDIKFDDAAICEASINGSGDIGAKKVGILTSKINGSGDIKMHECEIMNVSISGSGDVDLDKITKAVSVSIRGSGEVNIKEGEVETFDVNLDNGEVRAKGVTTDRANITIENRGRVEIGRVKIESIEKCGDNAEVIIHKRG